jgi:antitoxin VapB
MNDMTPLPRHRQKPISFRSDRAAHLLAQLTSDGRSQAQVIEEALAKEVEAKPKLSSEEFIARIDAIVKPGHGIRRPTREEIEAELYDENGLPR